MNTHIVQKEHPVLRAIAKEVPEKEIESSPIQDIIERMKKALHREDDGVAIAAPQIGEPWRIFVMSGKAQAIVKNEDSETSTYPDIVFINPVIKKISKKKSKNKNK